MSAPVSGPDVHVTADAWTGAEAASGPFVENRRRWALGEHGYGMQTMRPGAVDQTDWRDPRVGWGLVVAEPPDADQGALAELADLPEDLVRLVRAREGRVFRYRAASKLADWTLRDYAAGAELLTAASPVGAGAGQLPAYLLIYGSPEAIPWHVQFRLNPVRYVGRLDLDGEGLTRYVDALLGEWSGAASRWNSPVIWAVDHRNGDITTLMRDVVARPVAEAMAADNEMTPLYIDGAASAATVGRLIDALAERHPAVIVTSSHGATGPLTDLDRMRADLGLPVDADHALLDPAGLLSAWQPDGAVWFAQACCSAGAESPSAYEGLFGSNTSLENVLTGVAAVGARISPLARAALGAEKPARAFVGHVEPTFDWTLSFPPNRQTLTDDLRTSLYDRLCLGQPIGLAFAPFYRPVGSLLQGYLAEVRRQQTATGDAAQRGLDMMVYSRVTALDRASTVILGDPTVSVPLPS